MARWKLLEEGGLLWGYCMELIKYTIPWSYKAKGEGERTTQGLDSGYPNPGYPFG